MYVKCALCEPVFLALWLRKEKSKVCFRITKTLLPVTRKTAIRIQFKTSLWHVLQKTEKNSVTVTCTSA